MRYRLGFACVCAAGLLAGGGECAAQAGGAAPAAVKPPYPWAEIPINPPGATLGEVLRKHPPALVKVLEEGQPAGGADAMEMIHQAGKLVAAVVKRDKKKDVYPLDALAMMHVVGTDEDRALAAKEVAELDAAGVAKMMAEIVASPRCMPKIERDQDILGLLMPQLLETRNLARYSACKAVVCLQQRDSAGFLEHLGEILSVSRHAWNQPCQVSSLVGGIERSLALEVLRAALVTHSLSDGELADLDKRIRAAPRPPLARAMLSEELQTEQKTEILYFGGPGCLAENAPPIKPNQRVIAEGSPLSPGMPNRVMQVRLTRMFFEYLIDRAIARRDHRGEVKAAPELQAAFGKNRLIDILNEGFPKVENAFDFAAADDIGTLTLIALERYYLAHHAYPETLAALVPQYLPEVPVDPYNGKSLGYLAPKAGRYEGGRAFLLYAAGADCKDDGGKIDFGDIDAATHENAKPLDLLLNRETLQAGAGVGSESRPTKAK